MQPSDEDPQPLLQIRREIAVAEFKLSLLADPNPGPFGGGSSVAGWPLAVGHQQISVQFHRQCTVALAAGKGGAGGEQKGVHVLIGLLLPVPPTEEFERRPTRIDDHARVANVDGAAVGSWQLQHLVLLQLRQMVPRRGGRWLGWQTWKHKGALPSQWVVFPMARMDQPGQTCTQHSCGKAENQKAQGTQWGATGKPFCAETWCQARSRRS